MTVLIPQVGEDNKVVQFKPQVENSGMQIFYKQGNFKGIRAFENKQPVFDEESGGYFLDFRGRVDLPSVKNFQIIDMDDGDYFVFFGDCFSCGR